MPSPTVTSTPAFPQCMESPPDPDLVGCWSFDGTVADASSFDHQVQIVDVDFTSGVAGSSATFASTSNFVVTTNPAFDGQDVTVETWVLVGSLPVSRAALVHKAPTFRLSLLPTGSIQCVMDGDDVLATPAGSLTPQSWTHVACTHQSGGGASAHRIYVNGIRLADRGAQDALATSTQDLRFGETSAGDEQLVGALDVLRLWSRIRTDEEICAAAGKTGCGATD